MQLSVEDAVINLQSLSATYEQWQLNTQLDAELLGNLPVKGLVTLKSDEHQANLELNGDLADLTIHLET
ncbi:hypothetical protein R2R70_23030, partial [Cobetia sp. SIMBA_158]|uniref:hypothetical protein n=1 Tax=Cobetia sp. SIMBA_158 TaxID=3081617 RepID=UPI003980B43D